MNSPGWVLYVTVCRRAGATHAGVGVAAAVPPSIGWSGAAGLLGFAVSLLLTCKTARLPDNGAVFVRAYVVPVALAAGLFVAMPLPGSWDHATLLLRKFAEELFSRTRWWMAVCVLAMGVFERPGAGNERSHPPSLSVA